MIICSLSPFPDKLCKRENQTPAREDTERHTFGTLKSTKLIVTFLPSLNSTCVPQDPTPNPKSLGNFKSLARAHSVTQ